MSRLPMLPGRVPAAGARLTKRPKVSDQFYSSPEWRKLMRDLIAIRGRAMSPSFPIFSQASMLGRWEGDFFVTVRRF